MRKMKKYYRTVKLGSGIKYIVYDENLKVVAKEEREPVDLIRVAGKNDIITAFYETRAISNELVELIGRPDGEAVRAAVKSFKPKNWR